MVCECFGWMVGDWCWDLMSRCYLESYNRG